MYEWPFLLATSLCQKGMFLLAHERVGGAAMRLPRQWLCARLRVPPPRARSLVTCEPGDLVPSPQLQGVNDGPHMTRDCTLGARRRLPRFCLLIALSPALIAPGLPDVQPVLRLLPARRRPIVRRVRVSAS